LWGSRAWGETDPHLIALLERQLARVAPGRPGSPAGPEDQARHVRLLATLATEHWFGDLAERGWAFAIEALRIARQLRQPQELGLAVSVYLTQALGTDHLPERRALLDELLASPSGTGGAPGPELPPLVTALLHATRLTERLRHWEIARFDADFPVAWRLACDLRSPELLGQLRFIQATRYINAGDLDLGLDIATRGFQAMGSVTVSWRQPARFAMDCCVMLATGTLGEHADELAAGLAQPGHPSLPHLMAPAAALGFAQAGDSRRAAELTARWFTPPPRSWSWSMAIAYWAQVAIAIGQPDPAWLHEMLAPHSGELAIVGTGLDCGGAVDSLLAGLAWRLGRRQEAARLAAAGLALETRLGNKTWITRTTGLLRQLGEPGG
jgi:hypothetical protein